MSILLTFCSIVTEYQFDYSTAFCLACYFIIVQNVFVRLSPFRRCRYRWVTLMCMVQLKFCLSAFFSLFFQNIHATIAQTSQVQMAAEENVNRPSFMVASTVTVKCYGQLGTSYPSSIFVRTSRSNIWCGGL